jgi:hypothetical protein
MALRGVTKHSSMNDWLKSPAPGRGGSGGKFLSGWKMKPGHVDTWQHAKCLPMTVWRHPMPMFVPVKKEGVEVVHVWTKKFTCHETEDVLKELFFRTDREDPGSERKTPPKRCGECKYVEWLWQQCWLWLQTHKWIAEIDEDTGKAKNAGKWVELKKGKGKGIDPCARLYRFTSEADDKENLTIHVGGFCGLFGRKDPPDDLESAMRAAKISPKDAWKESGMVKAASVMCVVNNDDPASGVQISEETKELGEKVKEEIIRVYKSQEVDIQKHPYCIRWEYDSKAQMGKMYTATAMMKIQPTPRILKLIRGEAPDLSQIETPFNQASMRTVHERYCLLKNAEGESVVPWDEFFPSKEQEAKWAEEDDAEFEEEDEAEAEEDEGEEEGEEDESEAPHPPVTKEDDEEDEDDDEMVLCDVAACRKPMKASATKCPHCGHQYEVEPEPDPEPAPEPPPLRSRSDIAKAKAAAKAPAPKDAVDRAIAKKKTAGGGAKKATPKPPAETQREPGDDAEEDEDEDSIPFAFTRGISGRV